MLDKPPESRRLKRIGIPPTLLMEFVRTGWEAKPGLRCIEGVPITAQYVGCTFDPNTMMVYVFFTDASFEEIPENAVVPFVSVKYGVVQ